MEKFKNGTISAEELKVLENWYADNLQKAEPFNHPQAFLRDMEILDNAFPFVKDAPKATYKLWPRIAVAVAVATIIFGAGLFYFTNQNLKTEQGIALLQDVAPGKMGATLTLSNGKKILLADAQTGQLASESGIQISKSADGEIVYKAVSALVQGANELNTLQTMRKEQVQIQLPDGTQVWLNSESSLTYPATFTGKQERSVKLTGEAYFQVAKDKSHPFKVRTSKQEVQVLGTHFNINAYADEPIVKTTLIEGSVKLSADRAVVIIKPGEEAALTGNQFKISEADLGEALSWKNGDFVFNGERIESIMRKLARWYDVDVIYDGLVPEDEFYAEISKFRNISQVLAQLENTKGAHFKIEGRRVIVSKFTK